MNYQSPTFQFHEALNAAFLHDLFAGDLSYAIIVFQDVLNELPTCWMDVEEAYGENDVKRLKSAAHKCKTLVAYVGLSDMQSQLQAIETRCEEVSSTTQLEMDLHSLKLQIAQAETIILEEIKRLKVFHEN